MLVIQIEFNVAGAVVAIYNSNVPGEGDVGAVPTGHVEVADMIVLGSCTEMKKEMVSLHRITMLSSYC